MSQTLFFSILDFVRVRLTLRRACLRLRRAFLCWLLALLFGSFWRIGIWAGYLGQAGLLYRLVSLHFSSCHGALMDFSHMWIHIAIKKIVLTPKWAHFSRLSSLGAYVFWTLWILVITLKKNSRNKIVQENSNELLKSPRSVWWKEQR